MYVSYDFETLFNRFCTRVKISSVESKKYFVLKTSLIKLPNYKMKLL